MIHYILVRRDLPFGDTLAQVGHAAAESMAEWLKYHTDTEDLDFPEHEGMTLVVLGVRDRIALRNWELRLLRKGVELTSILEPDMNNQLTALGIWPNKRDSLEKHFKKLATYKELGS